MITLPLSLRSISVSQSSRLHPGISTTKMEQHKTTSINSIPPELLDEIFSLLVRPPPSLKRLYDQPFYDVTQSTVVDLKSCSCVSQRWRRAALPILFQNTRMLLRLDTVQSNWPTQVTEFLAFVRTSNCQSSVESFTLIIQDPRPERYYYDDLQSSLASLKDHWQLIFDVIDPLRLTIVAPPPVLGGLAALHICLDGADEFHMPYHILSLSRSPSPNSARKHSHVVPNGTTLLHLRPWETLLLNEGSFIRPYSTTNYHTLIAKTPSVLPSLVTKRSSPQSLLPKTIKSISYIALFPSAYHTAYLYAFLPDVQRLYIQLSPRHDLYPDTLQRGFSDMTTMILERQWAYKLLLQNFFSTLISYPLDLAEIACGDGGDVGDDNSWNSVVQREILNLPGRWNMDPEREGVLVRIGK